MFDAKALANLSSVDWLLNAFFDESSFLLHKTFIEDAPIVRISSKVLKIDDWVYF